MMKVLNNRGYVKGIIGLILFVVVVFLCIEFGKPYYRYYSLSSHTSDFLKTDIGDVEVIRKNVLKDAAEVGVPLKDGDLQVVKVQKVIKVKAKWTDTVDLWGFYQQSFDFEMEEEL